VLHREVDKGESTRPTELSTRAVDVAYAALMRPLPNAATDEVRTM